MARTIAEIQQQILSNVAGDATLSPLMTSTSKRAIYNLWAFIVAVAIAVFEQILDVFKSTVEATVAKGSPSSAPWLQNQVLLFQYSSVTPQVVQLIDFAPAYPVVDPLLRIVTRASVTSDLSNSVIIKAAKSDPPEALDPLEIAALQSYINLVGAAGITYVVRSTDPDRLYVNATVFYSGLYSSVIQANVITAISSYLANLPFNGSLKITDIEQAIRGVPGVNDVILKNIKARSESVVFADGTFLVLDNATVARLWPTQAGYIIQEDTAGQTFADSLLFIPE